MPATDTSAVQITINVVDGNSGEVVSRVTKSLNALGDAGAGNGKKLKQGLNDAGEAGTTAGQKIGAGMKEAGGHSLNALDNVRLVRDDLGIHIPRAMEKVISQSAVLMGAIGAIGSGLVALGAIEVIVHMGEQVYQLYEKWLDTNKEVKAYREKAAEAAQQKLFDDASFDTAVGFLRQANQQMEQLQAKKKARENSSILDNIFLPGSTAKRFTPDDDKAQAKATEVVDRESLRVLQQSHELMLKNIDDHEKLQKASANSAGAIGAERRAARQRDNENLSYTKAVEQANVEIYNRAHIRDPKKFPGTYQPSKEAGQQEFSAAENSADLSGKAASTELAFQQQRDLMQLKNQADQQDLAGGRLLEAQRVAAVEELNAKYKGQTDRNRAYAAEEAEINRRFDRERQGHLEEQTREVAKRIAEESSKGLTGLAAVDARANAAKGQVDADRKQGKFYGNSEQQEQYASGLKGAIDSGAVAEGLQRQQQFTDRLAEMDASRSDRFASESDRIASSAQRTIAEITKAWTETYGQLGAMDARRVQSYQQLQGEIQRINADTTAQQLKVRQQITDETVKAERAGARGGGNPERERTQAILDEYQDRFDKLEELRKNDAANADLYRRQEIAADQEKNNKLLDQQKQMRDKLAGELKGFFSNPLEALKSQGEEAASKIAASYLLKLRGPQAGTAPTGGIGAIGSALPQSWKDVGGLFHRQEGGSLRPGPLTAAPASAATVSAASSTLNASTATIHIGSATITGAGGSGSGASSLRPASYSGGSSIADLTGTSGGGIAGSMVAADASSSSGGDSGGFSGNGSGGFSGSAGAGAPWADNSSWTGAGVSNGGMVALPAATREAGGGPGAKASVSGTLNTLGGMGTNLDDLTKTLGMKDGIASKVPGLAGASSKLGGLAQKYSGAISGATTLFSAFEGGGGVGGALQGALGGAQIGAQFAGPAGAAVGALAGAAIGLIGYGARQKAETYDKHQVKPRIKDDLQAFESGSTDYQTVYDDMDAMSRDAKTATKAFGSAGLSYYNDTIKGEIQAAQQRLTRENKAGRSSFGFTAAQFHEGGRISGFGSLATTGNQGFIHAEQDEFMVRQQPAMEHSTALQYINAGASHGDMAAYYGGNAATAQPAGGGSDVNLHFHSHDAKGAAQLFMDNKHVIRRALNDSYAENSGGSDF